MDDRAVMDDALIRATDAVYELQEENEKLQERIAELEAALAPLAMLDTGGICGNEVLYYDGKVALKAKHARAAKRAMGNK